MLRSRSSIMAVTSATSSSAPSTTTLCTSARSIRSVVPPRPLVTTIMYLDGYGRAIRSKTQESPLSFARTRDNKFWLQRVLPDGEVVRWRALGLDRLKHAVNFETYNLNELDEYGGVVVPMEVFPTVANDPPPFQDVVHMMMKLHASQKITRKVRRSWHRRLAVHWKDDAQKYYMKISETVFFPILVIIWFFNRLAHSIMNKKPFWDHDVYHADGADNRIDPIARLKKFSDTHPEQDGYDDRMITMLSPMQSRLSSARAELRESDVTDPHFHSELWWKLRHMRFYGHWPKSLMD